MRGRKIKRMLKDGICANDSFGYFRYWKCREINGGILVETLERSPFQPSAVYTPEEFVANFRPLTKKEKSEIVLDELEGWE